MTSEEIKAIRKQGELAALRDAVQTQVNSVIRLAFEEYLTRSKAQDWITAMRKRVANASDSLSSIRQLLDELDALDRPQAQDRQPTTI